VRKILYVIITVSGHEPDARRIAPGHHPIAVVLELVNPFRTHGRLVGGGWQARFDEPDGGAQTREHGRFRCRNDERESSCGALVCSADRRLIKKG
jgi:hypothetical protein